MELFASIMLLVLGLIIIVLAGNYMVSNAVSISKITHIPQVLIGATIVSLATTLPELSVTIFSSIGKLDNLAIGNAVGSVIFNLSFIIGIVLLFTRSPIDRSTMGKNFYMMFGTSLIIFILSIFNCINRWSGLLLLGIFVCFFVSNIIDANRKIRIDGVVIQKKEKTNKRKLFWVIASFVFSSFFVAFGAKILVQNGANIARLLGISEHIIGVTIIAIGTSLPEVVTAVSSIRQNSTSIAIGNTIGANVLASTLLIGISAVLQGGTLTFHPNITYFALPVILISSIVIFLPIRLGKQMYRLQGMILLLLFAIYYGTVMW